MPEQKARVAAMRKLLVIVYGTQRAAVARGVGFDAARVYRCQSQYAAWGGTPCRSRSR